MPREATISEIIDYPLDRSGSLVTRRGGLTKMKPRLNAPPPNQIGSLEWTLTLMFGSRQKAMEIIESIVEGQGDNVDEKWTRFCLLYRQWEIQFSKGDLEEPPTLNQVAHSLNFDARTFLSELQGGISALFTKVGALKATIAIPEIVDKVVEVAKSDEGDKGDRELALKLGGMLDDKSGLSIQINNQNAVLLKGEKERMKSPLLQFSETVEVIDNEVRDSDSIRPDR